MLEKKKPALIASDFEQVGVLQSLLPSSPLHLKEKNNEIGLIFFTNYVCFLNLLCNYVFFSSYSENRERRKKGKTSFAPITLI